MDRIMIEMEHHRQMMEIAGETEIVKQLDELKKLMNIQELGREGEQQARLKLKEQGYWIGQIDWLGKKDGEWVKFEIKRKEMYLSPPFDGHGLDQRQVEFSAELFRDTGIRTYLLIYEIGTDRWIGQYLDILEAGEKHLTRNNVKIYNINNFEEWN